MPAFRRAARLLLITGCLPLGEELQHDTSPHSVQIAGKKRKAQTASAVLSYSRMLYFQLYPAFQRFDCKVFLTDALRYLGGSPHKRVMIDNTHVVVLRGTGKDMVPVPEMAAFAERFGFQFAAHERGDADRSARVANLPPHLAFTDHRDGEARALKDPSDRIVRSGSLA